MHFGRGRAVIAGVALALACAATFNAARAATGKVAAEIAPEGYARIVFSFDRLPDAKTKLNNGVLIVSFDESVDLDLAQLTRTLGDLVAVARRDPDGTAVRLALKQPVKLHAQQAGEKLFVDLLPPQWKGVTPPLPAEVIADLNREARQNREIRAEAERLRARPREPMTLEGATHPTFRRLILTLPDDVDVDVGREDQRVAVTVAAALPFDLDAARARLPPELMALDVVRSNDQLKIYAPDPGGRDVRGFREDGRFIVDIDRDDADAPVAEAGTGQAPAVGHEARASQEKPGSTPAPAAPSSAVAPKAAPPVQASVAAAKAAPEPAKPAAADARVAPAAHDVDDGAPASASEPSPGRPGRTDGATVDAATSAPGPAPRQAGPSVKRVADTLRLTFPFAHPTPAAVFVRGTTLWAVFDDATPIDLAPLLRDGTGVITSADQTRLENGVALRLKFAERRLVTASADGATWTVSIGDSLLGRKGDLELTPVFGQDGRAAMQIAAPGVGAIRTLRDPDVGDTLSVVTLAGPARGMKRLQQFIEFSSLATAQGAAFAMLADDLQVTADIDTVKVARNGGLTISTATDAAPGPAAAEAKSGDAALDAASWSNETSQPFVKRERELMLSAALATPEDRTEARYALARFYQARGRAVESKAVLDVILEDDPTAVRDRRIPVLRAAAAVELDHYKAALAMLAAPELAASPEAALWRAAANAGLGRSGQARDALAQGGSVIGSLPAELQSRFVELSVRLALDADDHATAASQFQRLEVLPAISGVGAREILRARVAEALGLIDQALAAYDAEARGREPAAAAEATLRATELSLKFKKIKDAEAIARLERLAAGWRGDWIEAETLSTLVDLYGQEERWRDAFATLQTAVAAFPDADSSRSLQDKMQNQFTSIFLSGGLDRMSKVDALALFYDFKDLSPGGKRGDELVRRLADKLVEVDLLDQAAELLDYQIDHRLVGAARAQVAARAALVDLMNGKPQNAVEVLRKTRQADLPSSLMQSRIALEARALALTGRTDLALEMARGLDGAESRRLTADILWSARRWNEAGEAIETLLGSVWRDQKPLDVAQRRDVLKAAIALSLGGDGLGLDRLRQKFAAKMAASADAPGFDVVTAPVEARGDAFRELARSIATSASFDAFLQDYRKRAAEEDAASPAERSASAAPNRKV